VAYYAPVGEGVNEHWSTNRCPPSLGRAEARRSAAAETESSSS